MIFKKTIILLIVFITSFLIFRYLQSNDRVKEFLFPKTTVQFTTDLHDFGTIARHKPVQYYFVYQNTGTEPFIINKVTAGCGCTVPKWPKQELLPGKKDSILVLYDAKSPGFFNKSVVVISNATTSPDVLYIKGNVAN